MLFKLHCILEYFLEVPLAGIKSHEPLHLDRGISVKWQVMVARQLIREPQLLSYLMKLRALPPHKETVDYFLNLMGTSKKHYTMLFRKV